VKYCEIIADNLGKAGWSYGYGPSAGSCGERSGLWTPIAAALGVTFVRADEKLTAFLELESIVRNAISCQRQASPYIKIR